MDGRDREWTTEGPLLLLARSDRLAHFPTSLSDEDEREKGRENTCLHFQAAAAGFRKKERVMQK